MATQEPENIDLEAQSKELDAMSQALLSRLNVMVEEQERRASEFADKTHSLSSLPEVTPIPQVQEAPTLAAAQPLPEVAPVTPPPARKVQPPPTVAKKVAPPPTSRSTAVPQPPASARTSSHDEGKRKVPKAMNWLENMANRDNGGEEERSPVSGNMIVIILIIGIFILRSCS